VIQPTRRAVLAGLGGTALAAYTSGGVAMWGWQELLIFPAPTLDVALLDGIAARTGADVLRLRSGDGTAIYGWHRPAAGVRAVVFFHGNAETVADRVPLHDFLVEHGWDVVIIAYRGYPGSEGAPTEDGLRLDARAAWRFATERLGIPRQHVVIHGKSLGGGVAALLAEEVDPGGLVMESTFTSITDVAKGRFPLYPSSLLVRHPFDTKSRAPLIDCPTLVIHADRDQTIPVEHGRELAKLFPNCTYVEVAGLGHGETLPLVDPGARAAYLGLLERVAAA
jgi:pimeloyl-ACP methyl ester carboxylesterase